MIAAVATKRFRRMEEPSGVITLSFDDVKSVSPNNEKAELCGDAETNIRVELKSRQPAKYLFVFFSDASAAQAFASGVNWFAQNGKQALREAQGPEQFKSQAAQWRAANPKPTMPESAHEHQVLAENAIQEKNISKAIDEYEAALAIFPAWPEGQFNVALLCGETDDYASAVEHMQHYLELVPDAKNAEGAKDKIIIWKDKLSQSAPAPQESAR